MLHYLIMLRNFNFIDVFLASWCWVIRLLSLHFSLGELANLLIWTLVYRGKRNQTAWMFVSVNILHVVIVLGLGGTEWCSHIRVSMLLCLNIGRVSKWQNNSYSVSLCRAYVRFMDVPLKSLLHSRTCQLLSLFLMWLLVLHHLFVCAFDVTRVFLTPGFFISLINYPCTLPALPLHLNFLIKDSFPVPMPWHGNIHTGYG